MPDYIGKMLEPVLAWTVGYPEVIVVLVVVLVLFGGKKLPELSRGLARALRVFRDEVKGIKTDIEEDADKDSSNQKEQSGQDQSGQEQKK